MKKRIDVLLYEKGLAPSREKARTLIMAGCVYADNQKFDKPGDTVREDAVLEVRGNTLRYVSRGGLKLEKAMQLFPIKLENTVCMDIGASTGGFTDCMLQNGASKVYSVDVGYGQLAWQLRTDPRVVFLSTPSGWRATAKTDKVFICFCAKGRRICLFKTREEKICRWRFKKDKFWVLIWCEGSGKSVCASASHCG